MTERVLVVDDDPDFRRFAELAVARLGYETRSCGSADEALAILAAEAYDAVLVDVFLVGASGIELCSRIAERWENLPVVVMTAQGTLETAVDAIRAGAYDFVTKPPSPEALRIALERATAHRRMKDEVLRLRRAVKETTAFEEIIGASAAMKRVFDLVDRAADSDVSVLITGESGTGKELVARALHRRSPRAQKPFVALSCAAVPEQLLESELFGYVKGAFTDARTPRAGLLAQAAGGTLFLDEIGDMSLSLQPKLLRALQERRFRPVGGNDEASFDARIVTATNRDLESGVEDRTFRQDLYFRINVVRIHLPPLRARGNDVLLIAQTLLERYASVSGRNVTGLTKSAARASPRVPLARQRARALRTASSARSPSRATSSSRSTTSRTASATISAVKSGRPAPTSGRWTSSRSRTSSGATSSACSTRSAETRRSRRRCSASIARRSTASSNATKRSATKRRAHPPSRPPPTAPPNKLTDLVVQSLGRDGVAARARSKTGFAARSASSQVPPSPRFMRVRTSSRTAATALRSRRP